jgi:hypothetical protein
MDVIVLFLSYNKLHVNPTLIHMDFKAHDLLLLQYTFFSGSMKHNNVTPLKHFP